ncbi:ligand-gated channel protein [Marinobacter nanhaiticus D15-8W]|uniref:Ligand-gated channel protein n=1 Tax=Marinobacter nanhaiticus D15-8W TaxID=626887 RepID=N6X292_9GAMM|nr:ligand-gated channel protein [Marinobacter nanhaiticus]ENO15168.1 ligand-gated channel protein [Marinobacter nanhaiticus D15-8W]BES69131.1 ligand-gated channel protein [Marinobacter nanhaiticus D15-8W]
MAVQNTKRAAVLGTGLALMNSLAWADDSIALNELVVTAAGYEQEIVDAPASISVIDSEKLNKGAYEDVTDALREIPGVIVTGGGAGDNGADISMRGMPAAYTLILVDGKRQASRESRPNGSAGFEQDWLPPLGAIERIEVVRGPMSTLYGSDAIGGVINIITRKVPQDWSGDVEISTIIQEDQDSGNVQQANFNVGGPLIENLLGLQIYGQQYSREEDKIINGYEEKELQSVTGRLALTPTPDHDFVLEAGVTDQRRRSFVGVSAPAEGCTDSDNTHIHKHYSLSHTGRWDIGTSDTYVQQEATENRSREMEITNTVAKSSLVMPLANHMVSVGATYELQELDDQTSNRISDRTHVDAYKWAVFAEDEWMLTDNFSLTGGARLDEDENYGSHVSPRLYGVWQFASAWTLKGGVSTGYRSPNLREITPDWGQVSRGGNIYGNPDLEPETSVSQEIGLHYNGESGLSSSLTVFYNDFEDKITRVGCPITTCTDGPNDFGADPTYRINVDEAVTQGVEFTLSAPLTDTIDVSTSYTYTDSEQKSGEYEGEPLTQLPKHLVSASLDWQASSRLATWVRATYRGEESQPTTGPSQSDTVAPSYTFVDTGLGYELTSNTTVKAGIYNILDEDVNYDEYGFTEDGRRYWLALNVGF